MPITKPKTSRESTNPKKVKSKHKKPKQPNVRFQIVDYFNQDRTNEHLGLSNDLDPTIPSSDASYVEKKILSWWNWCKNTLYPQVNNYRLHIFGRTEDYKSICTHVNEFKPYMYVKLPTKWKSNTPEYGKFKEWILKELWLNNRFTPKKIPKYDPANRPGKAAFTNIDYKNVPIVGDPNDRKCPLRWNAFYKCLKKYGLVDEMLYLVGVDRFTYVKRNILKKFTEGKKFPFVRIVCNSKKGFNRVKNVFQHNKNKTWDNYEAVPTVVTIPECNVENHIFPLYEADINPICRFTDHANVKGCGWAYVTSYTKPLADLTKCNIDIETSWKNIYPLEKDGLANMVMAFYDIECDSSHGEFPMAKKKYTMTVNEILTEFQRLYTLKSVQHEIRIKIADGESNDEEYVLSTRQQNIMNTKIPNMDVHFIKDLLRAAFMKGSEEHTISRVYWKKKTKLSMSKWDLWEKDLTNHVPTVEAYFDYIRNTTKGKGYVKAIDELYKMMNQKFLSRKMKEFIEKNIEKAKIGAFLRINGKIIAECASKINQYISVDYNASALQGTALSAEKQKNMYKARAILDKYLPPIKGDSIIQIGTCLKRQGESEIYKNHILTLGTCNDIPNAEVVVCKDEGDLIMKWKQLLEDEDVDVMLGYNNYEFDYPYIWKRAEETGVLDQYRTLSKFKDKLSYMREKKLSSSALGDNIWEEIDNVGRAHIDLMRVIRDDVTINLDRYTLDFASSVFMRGGVHDCVYDEESDTTVICTNSVNGLHEESYIKFSYTKCHTDDYYNEGEKLKITEIIKDFTYIKDTGDGEEIKTNAFRVKGKVKLNITNKYSWTMAKDDVSPADIFRLQKGSAEDRCIIAKYCLKDVILTVELADKLTVLVNKTGMANVCCVPLMWIFTRGQTAKTYSLVSKECRNLGYVIPTLYRKESGSYAGAVVLPPNPGIYVKRPVAVLDFGSLYPSIIINNNMSHETLVRDIKYKGKKGAKLLRKRGYDFKDIHIYDWVQQDDGVYKRVLVRTHRFIQPKKEADGSVKEENRGIIPRILLKLLGARASTRAKIKYKTLTMKNGDKLIGLYDKKKGVLVDEHGNKHPVDENDIVSMVDTYSDFEKEIFNGLQLAYKVSANSVYGLLGASVSPIYCPEIAESTTADGRRLLEFAGTYTKENYRDRNFTYTNLNGEKEEIYIESTEVVYGDTDSIFVLYNIKNKAGEYIYNREAVKASIDISLDVEKNITPLFGYPHKLEYEKTFWPFMLVSKKRYAGDKYEFNAHKCKQTSMGLVTKRRDNAKIVKYVYGGILDIIMGEKDVEKGIVFMQQCIRDIMAGKFDFDKFVITKKLKGYYKNPNSIAHKVLADRMGERDPGNKPKVNSRLPYAYIKVEDVYETPPTDSDEQPPEPPPNHHIEALSEILGETGDLELQQLEDVAKEMNVSIAKVLTDVLGKKPTIVHMKKIMPGHDIEVYRKIKNDAKLVQKKPKPKKRRKRKPKKKKILQGDRIEHPKFIKEHSLELDFLHYVTNQVSKPVSQIFGLQLEKLDKKYQYPYDDKYYATKYQEFLLRYKHKEKPDMEADKKVRELRMKMAQKLLIEPILTQLEAQEEAKNSCKSRE